jgi:CspA family cold shock protein
MWWMRKMDEPNITKSVTGRVKWFNQFKGYGFVEVDGIFEDVFLHFSVIDQSGIKHVNNGDVILCDVAASNKGYQVTAIVELIQSNKYETRDSTAEEVMATMKWFNPSKGFGFAQLDSGEDVFIHANLLKKYKIETIEHNKRIRMSIRHTNFGYEAVDLIATLQS